MKITYEIPLYFIFFSPEKMTSAQTYSTSVFSTIIIRIVQEKKVGIIIKIERKLTMLPIITNLF